ncbi:transcription factor Rap1, putative [Talaromyces stipitatus ATCC 10500]|uniref:DNA-binding protein RAP1 n=1 Tax=Talaromyces stipitatus (strain ATCC 10500 / CBS 375.48 / QM 6759 / NRRL 1006) TaxID=441959 RepID=B8LTK7_TALSN|nr:transcription factor Rap1, putative [Talaromyces stipitatus ATCC 10500]EED23085.1 transcription factor Rap1, putative [Talaromyces stipitatus ATCC 10500]
MATVVYTKPPQDGSVGTLFEGYSFWVSANVPQRNRFKELIQINGGTVVLLEKDADIKLVDHAKRDIPLNSHSYTFIEKSIRNGRLEDPEDHRAGQRNRPVGAVGVPARSSRTPFSLQDDQILWDWVQPYEARGDQTAGNIIYQRLAEQNPRHTFQSWRDRYVKKLRGKPRPGGPAQGAGSPAPDPKATTTQVSKPGSGAAHSDTKRNGHAAQTFQGKAAGFKRDRLSYEGTSTISNLEVDHAAKKRRRATDYIPRNDPPSSNEADIDPQLETTDESQSAKYETASQFPLASDSQTSGISQLDGDTLVPLMTEGEEINTNGNAEALEAWIQKRIDDGRNSDHILLALSCTSMNAELADKVLDLLNAGKGIPTDMPGVWTEEDDKALTGQDGRAMERVMQKHGSEAFDERWQFLEQSARATELVSQGGQ